MGEMPLWVAVVGMSVFAVAATAWGLVWRLILRPVMLNNGSIPMTAYDYPLLGFFWSMLIFFLWFMWLWLLFRIFADIFRSKDLGGVAKTLWIIFVILLPFIGVFVYVVARGNSMTQRSIDVAMEQRAQFDSYVRQTASSGGSTADELDKLSALKDKGVLSDAEFSAAKARLLKAWGNLARRQSRVPIAQR